MLSVTDTSFWLLGLGLFPLALGFILMLLPSRLWQSLLPRLDQTDTAMGMLAAGLVALGLALTALYSQSLWEGWRSQHWQATPGVMMEARVAETRSPRSTNPYWEPRLRYRYIIDGQEHEGSRLSFDWEKTIDREALQARLTREWLPGTAVTVWVAPDNPGKSVLKQGASVWLVVFVGVGLVLIGVGLHLLRLAVQGWRAHRLESARTEKPRKATRPRGAAPVVISKRGKKGKA